MGDEQLAAYGGLRATHVLVRTAQFNGAADSAVFTTRGRWVNSDVGRPAGATDLTWVEHAYWPVIVVERLLWNHVGQHFLPPRGA